MIGRKNNLSNGQSNSCILLILEANTLEYKHGCFGIFLVNSPNSNKYVYCFLQRLFLCYVDETKKTISLEELMLGLTAGGLTAEQKEQTLKVLGRTASLDFLDFLTYIPLFIHIHDHILQDPVGTVVYRDMLTV